MAEEIKNVNAYFFKSNNSYQLTKLMLNNINKSNINLSKINILRKGYLNKKKLGNFLLKIIN